MTSKRAKKASAKVAPSVAAPDPITIAPAVGPNVDGLVDQARIAHALTDADRARVISEIESEET